MSKAYIGVDIGGTRTKSGLVLLQSGEVLNTVIHATETDSEEQFLARLRVAIQQHTTAAGNKGLQVGGIGFGITGFVNKNAVIDSTYGFISFMEDYPLAAIVERELGLPCKIDNDARVVALGEALYGAGQDFDRVLVLTLGTGLGLGFIKGGKLDDDLAFAHMGGHQTICENGVVCYCGKQGCLESLVSSNGIAQIAARLNKKNNIGFAFKDAAELFEKAKQGNTGANIIVDEFIGYLKTGIDNYINLFAPDVIVLGGGIAKGLQPYLQKLAHINFLPPYKTYQVRVALSALDEHSGILGSAALFRTDK